MNGRETSTMGAYQGYVSRQKEMADKISACAMEDARGGAILGGIKPHDPRGTLEAAIDSVTNGVGEAFSALECLSERLQQVLQPEVPSPIGAAGNACTQFPTSPAVSRLHGLRNELEVLTSRMNALRCRLDA